MRTELHFHLLPGVDDGPADEAEAVELASLAVADGTSTVVATPHVCRIEIADLSARVEQLSSALAGAGVELQLRQGGELSPDDVFAISQRELEEIAQGPPGRRWVLLEAPLVLTRASLRTAAEEVRGRGFDVLIGHPERSPSVSLDELRDHVAKGSIIQINASSLVGGHGAQAERRALEIIRSGVPFVLASDAHAASRPPLLTEGARALSSDGVRTEVIAAAVDTAPGRLLREGLPEASSRSALTAHTSPTRFRRWRGRASRGLRRTEARSG